MSNNQKKNNKAPETKDLDAVEKPKKEAKYVAYKRVKFTAKIPKYGVDGKVMLRKTPAGNLMYDKKGNEIPIYKDIVFKNRVTKKGLKSYCLYKTSDPLEIKAFDKLVSDGNSCVITRMQFKKLENPAAYKTYIDAQEKLAVKDKTIAELKAKLAEVKA